MVTNKLKIDAAALMDCQRRCPADVLSWDYCVTLCAPRDMIATVGKTLVLRHSGSRNSLRIAGPPARLRQVFGFGLKFNSSRGPANTPSMEPSTSLQSSYPWTTTPIIANAPMGGDFATSALAKAVTQAKGFSFIRSVFDMDALAMELQKTSKALLGTKSPNPTAHSQLGQGFITFIQSYTTIALSNVLASQSDTTIAFVEVVKVARDSSLCI